MTMPSGPVASAFDWDTLVVETYTIRELVKDYLYIETTETSYDSVLERIVQAAGRKADEYLQNPFVDFVPKITVAGPDVDDAVSIDGVVYTAKSVVDADEREFAIGATDADTATNLAALINNTIVGGSYGQIGLKDVTATAASAVITLTKKYPRTKNIEVWTSDEDELRVNVYRTAGTVPEDIILWCLAFVAWRFANRDGRKSERAESGVTGIEWGDKPEMDLLEPYAMPYDVEID